MHTNALQEFIERISSGQTIGVNEFPPTFIADCKKVILSLGDRAGGRKDKRISNLRHIFTEKQYVREITMVRGSIIVTRKHLVDHPFIISKGVVTVFNPEEGISILSAPYLGVTKAGTERLLFVNEETIWTTIHPNDSNETCPDKIVLEVTEVTDFEFEEPDYLEKISQ
jgi:hypothetical protein